MPVAWSTFFPPSFEQVPSSPGYYKFNYSGTANLNSNPHTLVESLPACNTTTNATDAGLLLLFKASFTNGEEVLSDWVPGTSPCDEDWAGITCDDARMVTKM